jgi:aspartyl/asparaginyl beta-hydroxylase (cupin superfamily)
MATTTGEIRVPKDCPTLKEAVDRVHEDEHLTTIVLMAGEHHIDGDSLMPPSAMNIVGDPDVPLEQIVVVGGIFFNYGMQKNCHLQHMTIRQAKGMGVAGSSSFTMKDVVVEHCRSVGVCAMGMNVLGRATDVEVRHCRGSGVSGMTGGTMVLLGAKTTVHHNCTDGGSDAYGLVVSLDSASTIQLVSPLTKEDIATNNGGGGNWGAGWGSAITQIKTISLSDAGDIRSNHDANRPSRNTMDVDLSNAMDVDLSTLKTTVFDGGVLLEKQPPSFKTCSHCRQKILGKAKRCSACKHHHYCHKRCQVQHWKTHKRLCKWSKTAKKGDPLILRASKTQQLDVVTLATFPNETHTGLFSFNYQMVYVPVFDEKWETLLHTPMGIFGNEWNKGAALFDTLATTTSDPQQVYLTAMSHFESSMLVLKAIVENACVPDPERQEMECCDDRFSDIIDPYSELLATRSLFMGYCWSDYNDATNAESRLLDAVYFAQSATTLKDACLELLMLYEEQFHMGKAKQLIERYMAGIYYDQTSIWTHPMQRPGQVATCQQLTARPWWSARVGSNGGANVSRNAHDSLVCFPFVTVLEDNYQMILDEFNAIRHQSTSTGAMHDVGDHTLRETEDARVVEGQGWKETVLFGVNAQPHLAPNTCRLLKSCCSDEALSLVAMGGGEIIFSYLYGHTKIKPHCAATNHRLTCHLGLVVPNGSPREGGEEGEEGGEGEEGEEGKCSITVCGEEREWSVGKCLVFDDSFEHEVTNTMNGNRGILLLRFWHPELTLENRELAYREAMLERERQHKRRFDSCSRVL